MTVPTTIQRWTYAGDGARTVCAYTTRILSQLDLVVRLVTAAGGVTTLVLTTDYTVDGVLSYTGGNVTLLVAPAAGVTILITRDPSAVQLTSLQDQGTYRGPTVEQTIDLLTMEVQALAEKVARAYAMPVVEVGSYPTVPALATRASKTAGWDANGNFTISTPLPTTVVALTDAATIATDCSLGSTFDVTLGGNRTLGAPTGMVDGQRCVWRVKQDGTGSRTLAYNAVFRFGTDVVSPTLTTTLGKTDYVGAVYNLAALKWDVLSVAKGY